jgi:MFS family permease
MYTDADQTILMSILAPFFRKKEVIYWLYAWLGTSIAGSAFGVTVGILQDIWNPIAILLAVIAGFFIAGIFAIPYLLTASIATWAFWFFRFRLITAAVAGGWTGVVATRLVLGGTGGIGNGTVILAGVFGAVGCPLFAYLFTRKMFRRDKDRDAPPMPWQFTLRDLFVHFTVLAVLISLWTSFFTIVRESKAQRLQEQQQETQAAGDVAGQAE